VIATLNAARVRYVLAGELAFAIHAVPRRCDTIALLCHAAQRGRVGEALQSAGFRRVRDSLDCMDFGDRELAAEISVSLVARPAASAVRDAERHSAFGLAVPVIKPEYLLWLYCRSDLARSFADAVELIKAGRVDIGRLSILLDRCRDWRASAQLGRALRLAAAERNSSYSRSVANRRKR
jgi:hypothetical protein